jgi:hypothetical protein
MPNYCSNELYVRGEAKEIQRFLDACKGETPRYKLSEGEKRFYENDFNEVGDYSPVEHEQFTFNALVPVPQEILEIGYSNREGSAINAIMGLEKATDGYTWQIQNWGTKWDVNDPTINFNNEENEEAVLFFSTAWSPPVEWVDKVSELFPELEFELLYEEGGCCFAGQHIWRDGILQYDEYVDSDWEAYAQFCLEHGLMDQDYYEEIKAEMEEEE